MATVYDVAKEAKVSIATVSRVFNSGSNVSETTRLRVKQAADMLNYTPHLGARSLMIKRTDTIGVVLPDMYGEFFGEFVRGVDVAARKLGFHLLISCSHDHAEEMTAALSAMHGKVDGIVVMSPLINPQEFKKHIPEDVPVVILNGNREKAPYSVVNLDNYAGAYQMTEHLIAQGHQRIALISGPAANTDAQQRQLGYVEAIAAGASNNLPDVIAGDFSEVSGYEAGKQIIARKLRPDAVFAANDGMAIGCLCAFNEQGIIVPDDIALAGFDDIPLSRYIKPSLTTVSVPITEVGRKSIEILVDKLQKKNEASHRSEFVFSPSLVVRDSSKGR